MPLGVGTLDALMLPLDPGCKVRLQDLLLPPDLVRDLELGGGGGGGCDQSSASWAMAGVLAAAGANKFLRAAPVLGSDGDDPSREGNTIRSRDVTLDSSEKSNLKMHIRITKVTISNIYP